MNNCTSSNMNTFEELSVSCESSEPDTDSEGFGDAIRLAFGDLLDDLDVEWVDDSEDDEDDYRPNAGQYSQPLHFNFTRPITMDEFDAIMETVNGDQFGFGNGWEVL